MLRRDVRATLHEVTDRLLRGRRACISSRSRQILPGALTFLTSLPGRVPDPLDTSSAALAFFPA